MYLEGYSRPIIVQNVYGMDNRFFMYTPVVQGLCEGGVWPVGEQRRMKKINECSVVDAIFMTCHPLSLILRHRNQYFITFLLILKIIYSDFSIPILGKRTAFQFREN